MNAVRVKSSRKKIKTAVIIIEDSSKTIFGGGQRVSTIVAEVLSKSVYLVACDHVPKSVFFRRVEPFADELHSLTDDGYKSPKIPNIVRKILEYISIITKIYRIIIAIRCQSKTVVLYPTTKRGLLYSVILRYLIGVRVIFHVHFMPTLRCWNGVVPQVLLCLVDLNICVSDAVADKVLSKNKIVIANPFSRSNLPNVVKSKASVFGAVGTLIPEKGFQYLVSASKILQDNDGIQIHIYGDGPLTALLKKESNLRRVKYFGFVDDMDMEFASVIDVLILPSIIQEAAPMVIVEAFSYGVPVITTSIGGQATMVQDEINGLIVPPKSAVGLAAAINRIAKDKNLYRELSRNALESSKKYEKKHFDQAVLRLFAVDKYRAD